MPHVYRLHTGGTQTLDGWDVSKQYGTNEINNIVDPSGATASLPITSVPTPFASLNLQEMLLRIVELLTEMAQMISWEILSTIR